MNQIPVNEPTPAERRKRIKKIKRKRRIRLAIVIAAFILLLCAVAAPITALVIFRVDDYQIDGETRYTREEIIAASGIPNGSSLLFLNADKVKKSIEAKLPYIDTAKVEKKLPGTLVLTLTSAEKVYAFSNGTGGYILASSSFKALETVAEPVPGATIVKCAAVTAHTVGESISFANDENGEVLKLLKEINSALTEAELDGITLINMLDMDNIRLVYDSRLLLRLGSSEKTESKLSLGKKVIDDQNSVNPARYGMINLKVAKKAYFLPCTARDIAADSDSAKEVIPSNENGTEFNDEDEGKTDSSDSAETTSAAKETTTAAQVT